MESSDLSPIAAWPQLTRFYGISPLELAETPNIIIREYTRQLPELEAREQLQFLRGVDFPHMDLPDRKALYRNLIEMTTFDMPDEGAKVDITSAEGRRVLHGLGIKVVAG